MGRGLVSVSKTKLTISVTEQDQIGIHREVRGIV